MALADYQTLVDRMVRAPGGTEHIATTDRDAAIESARLRYSEDCERVQVEDVAWLAAGQFGPLPAGWTQGCWLQSVEYPIGEQPVSLLNAAVYLGSGGVQQLLLEDAILSPSDLVRVTFASPHLLQAGGSPADTIPLAHREAVASYAASLLCTQLAALFSSDRETSINADGAVTESRARNWAMRAKDYRAAYYAGIGKADPRADKAGAAGASSGTGAASVSTWSARERYSLTRGSLQ